MKRIYDNCHRVISKNIKASKKIIIKDENINIEFDYPLSNVVKFNFSKSGGFSIYDIIKYICSGYERIYREEEEEVGNPGHIPGMFNRMASNGPYGIWGHDINDLFIEAIDYDKKKKLITLSIGS